MLLCAAYAVIMPAVKTQVICSIVEKELWKVAEVAVEIISSRLLLALLQLGEKFVAVQP